MAIIERAVLLHVITYMDNVPRAVCLRHGDLDFDHFRWTTPKLTSLISTRTGVDSKNPVNTVMHLASLHLGGAFHAALSRNWGRVKTFEVDELPGWTQFAIMMPIGEVKHIRLFPSFSLQLLSEHNPPSPEMEQPDALGMKKAFHIIAESK